MTDFYGKYRGTVTGNVDPLRQGRVKISCPAVLGDGRNSWALPCVPYAGNGVGLYVVPPVGALIWVEFEAGDHDHPIWSGCFWGPGQAPPGVGRPEVAVLRTGGVTVTIDETPNTGGVTLEVGAPAVSAPLRVRLSASGIELVNGAAKVTLSATSVSVNDGALEVT